jgi:ATP-dependent DNA ligase
VFEPKLDGFRRGHAYKAFAPLATVLGHELEEHSAILDGELVCVGPDGQPRFYDLMFPSHTAGLLRV